MSESKQTQLFRAQLKRERPKNIVFKLSDRFTTGIPDMCNISEFGMSTFLEFKHVIQVLTNPINLEDVIGRGPQFVTMQKLGQRNASLYVIFVENKQTGQVHSVFVHPQAAGFKLITVTEIAKREETDVIEKFTKHGYVCAGTRQYLDPLHWLLKYMEDKRCELKLS